MRRRPVPRAARTVARTAALLSGVLVLLPTPHALAHPYVVGGGRVPVQSLATIELDLAHGCGVETAGGGADTDEVALEVPDWLRIVAVAERDGWHVTREEASDAQRAAGVVDSVVWEATTGAEPAPRFALDVVIDGAAGETRFLRVSQRCGSVVERWVGTPEAPAEQPAVRLRLEAADPLRPPPPLPEPEPEPAPEPEVEVESGTAPEAEAAQETPVLPEDVPVPVTTDPADETREAGGRWGAGVAAVGGALAVAAAFAARRRVRPSSTPHPD